MRKATAGRRSYLHTGRLACLGMLCATPDLVSAQVPNPNQVQVYMIRQDSSDCVNSTVSNAEDPLVNGAISVIRNNDGSTAVKVAMTASPDTTYHVFLKCVRQIGDLTTGDEGAGIQEFSFRTNLTGNVFAFDLSRRCPAGK